MRLIDADVLITELHQTADIGGELGDIVQVVKDYAVSMVLKQPTYSADTQAADVRENVRGEWKEVAERGLCDLRRCSSCGHIEPVGLEMITPKPSFCPNCGADMREEEDE